MSNNTMAKKSATTPTAHEAFGTEGSHDSTIDWSKTKDLTDSVTGLWPGNPSQRQGSFYISFNRLEINADETANIGFFPEGFVLERVDAHCIFAPDTDAEFSVFMGKTDPTTQLGLFHIGAASNHVCLMDDSECRPGTQVSGKKIYLTMNMDAPAEGRILIAMVGYQIEPWR